MAKTNLTKFFSVVILAIIVIACGLLFMSVNTYAATDEQDSNDVTAIDEQEPNDTRDRANVISMNSMIYGQTDGYNGYEEKNHTNDFFKLTPPISGTLKITAWDEATEEYGLDEPKVLITIKNSNNETIKSFYTKAESLDSTSLLFGVSYGETYYIEVQNSSVYNSLYIDYHFTVQYDVGKTGITKATPKKAAFYLKWNKKSNASYYQVRYTKKSTYNDYGWSKSTIYSTSSNSGSATIKGLSKKTAYYTAVRVVRVIDEETYYSSWSKAKTIKTK